MVGGTGDTDNVGTTVEFLDLSTEGAVWELLPALNEERCCWPQVRNTKTDANNLWELIGGVRQRGRTRARAHSIAWHLRARA